MLSQITDGLLPPTRKHPLAGNLQHSSSTERWLGYFQTAGSILFLWY